MERVLRFVAEYQWWLYGFLGLVLLFYLRLAIRARREGARSIYKLEQEQARASYNRRVAVMVVTLVMMGIVFGLTNFLLPDLDRPPEPTATLTSGPLPVATLTPTPLPPTPTPTPTATRALPTPTLRPSPTPGVVLPPTPVVQPPVCPIAAARLTSPAQNEVLRGTVTVRGTANIADLWYYKVEVAAGTSPADNAWMLVGPLHETPVDGGVLETFNSAAYPPGIYTLRLVVVDRTGNYPEPCRLTVTFQP